MSRDLWVVFNPTESFNHGEALFWTYAYSDWVTLDEANRFYDTANKKCPDGGYWVPMFFAEFININWRRIEDQIVQPVGRMLIHEIIEAVNDKKLENDHLFD